MAVTVFSCSDIVCVVSQNPPLQIAIDSNDVNKIKDVLECCENINDIRLRRRRTALMYALDTRSSNEVVDLLIDVGSDLNAECMDCRTPLMYALEQNYDKTVIKKLIDKGANVNRFSFDRTPLYFAIKYYKNEEIVSLLINAGADVHVRNIFGRSVLRAVNCNNCFDVASCNSAKVIDVLVKSGANLGESDEDGNTVVHWSDCCYLIELALKNGVSVNKKNNYDWTPLITAVHSYNYEKVKRLLLFNADPNFIGSELQNPLHFIRMPGSNKIFNLLAYHGTNVCARDVNGKTPLDLFLSKNFDDDNELKMTILPFIKHYLLFFDENLFNDSLKVLNNNSVIRSLMNVCESEIDKMKVTYIKDNLSFYEFCRLKNVFNSPFVEISINQYKYNYIEIKQLFPFFHDLIIMRMKDNYIKNCKVVLLRSLEKIKMKPFPVEEMEFNKSLGYDCFYYTCRYLNRKELYNLFLASVTN